MTIMADMEGLITTAVMRMATVADTETMTAVAIVVTTATGDTTEEEGSRV